MICTLCGMSMVCTQTVQWSAEDERTRRYYCVDCHVGVETVEIPKEEYVTLKRKAQNFETMISDHSRQKAREIIERNHV